MASTFVGPVFLALLVNAVDSGQLGIAYIYAVLMFVGLAIGSLADAQHYQLCMRGGERLSNTMGKKVVNTECSH